MLFRSENHHIIGFTSFLKQWIYLEQFGFHFPLGIIRDWVINPNRILNADVISQYLELLLYETWFAAFRRNTIALLVDLPVLPPNQQNVFTKIISHHHFPAQSGVGYSISHLSGNSDIGNIPTISDKITPFILGKGELFMYP